MSTGPVFSRGRKDSEVLLSGDAGHDSEQLAYKASQTLIAVGTVAHKVHVFNVLGILVFELDMNAPIVALEWIGDMSIPSVLSLRCRKLSEQKRFSITTPMDEEDSSSDDDQGTVKRVIPFDRHKLAQQPVRLDRFDGTHDLFSPRPPRTRIVTQDLGPFAIPVKQDQPRKQTFTRPRIMTETFKSPILKPQSLDSLPQQVASVSPLQNIHVDSKSQNVFDVFFSDALRVSNPSDRSSSSLSVSSHASDVDVFMTPPTSKKPPSRSCIQTSPSLRRGVVSVSSETGLRRFSSTTTMRNKASAILHATMPEMQTTASGTTNVGIPDPRESLWQQRPTIQSRLRRGKIEGLSPSPKCESHVPEQLAPRYTGDTKSSIYSWGHQNPTASTKQPDALGEVAVPERITLKRSCERVATAPMNALRKRERRRGRSSRETDLLRQEFVALREELRALKEVVLAWR